MTTDQNQQPPAIPRVSGPSRLAIASLVLGIVSVLGGAVLLIPTVLAIVFGHLAHSKTRKDPSVGGAGIAITGFVLGYASIFVGVFSAGLLAAMAIPAFQKVREESYHKAMQNDARHIALAAQQFMLEEGEKPVVFEVDPITGEVRGPLSLYLKPLMRGTQEVDGVIEHRGDGFSLRNPHFRRGVAVVFDAEGREK